ncbi:hypothetical protein COEREDRAFT_89541 [Coemansia reversa NRRL 1564]|uniref:Uncharacterized protein n=1 Tax=Coemansia reversa (strain ATCC 12441 / NRRL 1564) TaxID=763665 RepID=A0A2G5B427_COERN|nr:hypothetical protein COEREDRAFT_89541 [Coemansia reversa NRRL 1564]|eukprot:PIA13487.1 hypothetical protein COEREDRAFT_89541 [Coemansia reversa NRRL 1564]
MDARLEELKMLSCDGPAATDVFRQISSMPFTDDDNVVEKSEKTWVIVLIYNNKTFQEIRVYDTSLSLSRSLIIKTLAEKLGKYYQINILTLKEIFGDLSFDSIESCKDTLTRQISNGNFKKLECDEEITKNTCNFYAGLQPYIAFMVDTDKMESLINSIEGRCSVM